MPDTVQTRYFVKGMDCGSCAAKVDVAVRRLPGVEDVSVSAAAGTMTVRHVPDTPLFPSLKASLMALGYDVSPADGAPSQTRDHTRQSHRHDRDEPAGLHAHVHEHGADESGPWWRTPKGLLTIACGIALVAAHAVGK